MNILDTIIGWISPEAGARREAWRQNLEEMRNYDAGNYGRLNAGWIAYNQSAEQTDRYNRETVRARARDLERNSDMANSVPPERYRPGLDASGADEQREAEPGNRRGLEEMVQAPELRRYGDAEPHADGKDGGHPQEGRRRDPF